MNKFLNYQIFKNKIGSNNIHKITWILLVFSFYFGFSHFGFADTSSPKKNSLSQAFQKAKHKFDQASYSESAAILRVILKKYPNHKASLFLAGRIFYRLGSPNKAVKYFEESGDSFVNQDSAFDFGVSYFAVERCDKTLKALRLIEPSNPTWNLGQFYSGVCYYKAQKFRQAEQSLLNAKLLPRQLEGSKREILRNITRNQRSSQNSTQRRSFPNSSLSYTPIPIPNAGHPQSSSLPKLPRPGKSKKQEEEKATPLLDASSGFSLSISPSLTLVQSTYHAEKHQYTFIDGGDYGVDISIDNQFRYDMNESIAIGLPLKIDFSNKIAKNLSFQYVSDGEDGSDSGGNTYVQTLSDTNTNIKFWNLNTGPKVNFLALEYFDLELRYRYWHQVMDMNWSRRRNYMGPFAQLNFSKNTFAASFSAAQNQHENQRLGPMGADTLFNFTSSLILSDFKLALNTSKIEASHPDFALTPERTLGFKSRQVIDTSARYQPSFGTLGVGYEYLALEESEAMPTLNGSRGHGKIYGLLEKPFSFGLSLDGLVSQSQIPLYKFYRLSDKQEIRASGSILSARGGVKFSFLDWAFIKASYFRNQHTYKVSDANFELDFQQNTIDLEYGYDLALGVSTRF